MSLLYKALLQQFNARKVARILLPPVVFKLASLLREAQWEYVADDWPKDDPRSLGWDNPSVVENMRKKWVDYKRAVDGTGPLAFMPWATDDFTLYAHNHIMTYAFVLARAAHNKQRLSVLDWGGAMGHYAAVGKALLPEVSLEITIKERPEICAAGRELLPDMSFSSSEEVLSHRYDLVVVSGALQYVTDWRLTFRRLADAAEGWLFITVVPILRKARSFVVVQRPDSVGMDTEYISWVFNYDEFMACLSGSGFVLDRTFICSTERQHYRNAPESSELLGFLFRRS